MQIRSFQTSFFNFFISVISLPHKLKSPCDLFSFEFTVSVSEYISTPVVQFNNGIPLVTPAERHFSSQLPGCLFPSHVIVWWSNDRQCLQGDKISLHFGPCLSFSVRHTSHLFNDFNFPLISGPFLTTSHLFVQCCLEQIPQK